MGKEKEKKICLVEGQIDRLAHDSYMLGKGQTEGICETVAGIVERATTEEERIGIHKKKTQKKTGDIIERTSVKIIKGKIDKWIEDMF